MKRRNFLQAMLAAGVAPAAIGSGILMPVKEIIKSTDRYFNDPDDWYISNSDLYVGMYHPMTRYSERPNIMGLRFIALDDVASFREHGWVVT